MTNTSGTFMVRWVTRWDREGVTDLIARLADLHGVETTQETLNQSFEYALRLPDAVRFCAAVQDGRVIGLASLNQSYSSWKGRPCGTIEDVYVVDDARRTGIASAMFDFLFEQAKRRGYARLSLNVQGDNEAARAFYESYGMKSTGYVVYESELDETEE